MDIKHFDCVLDECRKLALSKNADYGDDGIIKFGVRGCIIRCYDKINRADNLTLNSPKHESLRDSLLDMINYAAYAVMLIDGNFK